MAEQRYDKYSVATINNKRFQKVSKHYMTTTLQPLKRNIAITAGMS